MVAGRRPPSLRRGARGAGRRRGTAAERRHAVRGLDQGFLGKLEAPAEWAEELLREGFALLPITPAHADAYRALPYVEVGGKALRDPFDRLLVCQAEVEGVPIVTRDPEIIAHGGATIW